MTGPAKAALCGALLATLLSRGASAQGPLSYRSALPTGLSLESSLGTIALRDEFISRERYSGGLPSFAVRWSHFQGDAAFHLALEFQRSSTIRSFNVSATITQFALRQGFLYPLTTFKLFSRTTWVFVGPSAQLFLFLNEQHVAVANPNFSESGAGLLSLGIDARVVVALGHGFQTELSARLAAVSLGLRVVDTEVKDVSPAKLLSPLSGLNGGTEFGVRYRLNRHLSAVASGRISVLRISAWDPLVAVSDGVAFGLTAGW